MLQEGSTPCRYGAVPICSALHRGKTAVLRVFVLFCSVASYDLLLLRLYLKDSLEVSPDSIPPCLSQLPGMLHPEHLLTLPCMQPWCASSCFRRHLHLSAGPRDALCPSRGAQPHPTAATSRAWCHSTQSSHPTVLVTEPTPHLISVLTFPCSVIKLTLEERKPGKENVCKILSQQQNILLLEDFSCISTIK